MFGLRVKIVGQFFKVEEALAKGRRRGLARVGFLVRKRAARSIRTGLGPSPEGRPPRTRRGDLRRALLYAVDEQTQSVVIGPAESRFGTAGEAHEHGGLYKGQEYPERPFMGPSIEEDPGELVREFEDVLTKHAAAY